MNQTWIRHESDMNHTWIRHESDMKSYMNHTYISSHLFVFPLLFLSTNLVCHPSTAGGSWRSLWFCCAWEPPLRPCRWPWCSSREHHDCTFSDLGWALKKNTWGRGRSLDIEVWLMYIYVYVYVYIYMYVCVYIYMYTHMYIYTYMYRPSQNRWCILPTFSGWFGLFWCKCAERLIPSMV